MFIFISCSIFIINWSQILWDKICSVIQSNLSLSHKKMVEKYFELQHLEHLIGWRGGKKVKMWKTHIPMLAFKRRINCLKIIYLKGKLWWNNARIFYYTNILALFHLKVNLIFRDKAYIIIIFIYYITIVLLQYK